MRYLPFTIGRTARDALMAHMTASIDAVTVADGTGHVLPPAIRAALFDHFDNAANTCKVAWSRHRGVASLSESQVSELTRGPDQAVAARIDVADSSYTWFIDDVACPGVRAPGHGGHRSFCTADRHR